jgi:transcriptional regulator with XRE-family HTH domain
LIESEYGKINARKGDSTMNLGEKIIELRKKEGYSQEELASLLDVSRQSVSKWELNASTPDLDKIVRLSEIFHVSIDSLLQEDRIEPEEHVARLMPQTEVEALVNLKEKSRLYMISSPNSRHAKQLNLEVLLGGFLYGKKIKIHYRF